MNPSDTDSDDDVEDMTRFLVAVDTALLTNDMYQQKSVKPNQSVPCEKILHPTAVAISIPLPKSQRYLPDDASADNLAGDLKFSSEVQTHIWRKLSFLLNQQVEYYDASTASQPTTKLKNKKHKSRNKVKLLNDSDCYVKPYEECIEDEIRGPQKKPEIRRRQIDPENSLATKTALHSIAVSSEDILNGADMRHWAKRPERSECVFHYKHKGGKLQYQEPNNEYSALRRKRNWHEGKIKQKSKVKLS